MKRGSYDVNCSSFQKEVPDWLSRRLPLELAKAMEAHQQTCPACARTAAAEARLNAALNASWRADLPPPAIDLWPRVEGRLSVSAPRGGRAILGKRVDFRTRMPRWALAATVVLAAAGLSSWGMLPHPPTGDSRIVGDSRTVVGQSRADQPAVPPGLSTRPGTLLRVSDTWPALRDVPQSDPAVDDPVGANMENVWTYLKTQNK